MVDTFNSKRSLLAIKPPTDKPYIDVKHASTPGFRVRVMKADSNGNVRKTYCYRWKERVPDGNGGLKDKDRNEWLGLVEPLPQEPAIRYEDAHEMVLNKRRVNREQKAKGGTTRLTVAGAWAKYATEKQVNRGRSFENDEERYAHCLQYLGDRYLDELDYGFWSDYVTALKAGTLQVGVKIVDDQEVPILRGSYRGASIKGYLTVASNLYGIAHKHRGLRGFAPKENPALDAVQLVGAVNKRKSHIPLNDLPTAWAASDQLISPWWRDLFRVLVLTGLRRSLLFAMRFDEVDWRTGILRIPQDRVGTKRRGRDITEDAEPIHLPLSRQVLEILRDRQRFAPDQSGPVWYTPQKQRGAKASGGVLTDPRKSWEAIMGQIGLHFTMQDVRRTYATLALVANGGGAILPISLLMLHSGSGLAAAVGIPAITVDYMNTEEAQAPMRVAAENVSAHLRALVSGAAEPSVNIELPMAIESALAAE